MRLVAHSTVLIRLFYHPFPLAKSPKITSKRVKLPQWYTCENTPYFQISLCRYSFSKTPLKRGKWLSLLVDFGQVPPLGGNKTRSYLLCLYHCCRVSHLIHFYLFQKVHNSEEWKLNKNVYSCEVYSHYFTCKEYTCRGMHLLQECVMQCSYALYLVGQEKYIMHNYIYD